VNLFPIHLGNIHQTPTSSTRSTITSSSTTKTTSAASSNSTSATTKSEPTNVPTVTNDPGFYSYRMSCMKLTLFMPSHLVLTS